MTRIGNDTKAPQTKSTAANDGARDATATSTTSTTTAEDVPTLDELDAGMSLERPSDSYESTELQSASGHTGVTPTGDGGMSSFEGMTPIEETPLAKDIAAVEQQCIAEVQGHAFELRTLGSEVGGADGACLEQASDALMTSSDAAGKALPGSALPVLAEGVTAADEHVKAVGDNDVRAKGEGIAQQAWSRLRGAAATVVDVVKNPRPRPAPGETHEIGIAGTVGIGILGGESKDVFSVARERNGDGRGGDYIVAREVTLGASIGLKKDPGFKVDAGGEEEETTKKPEISGKAGGSFRVEYRNSTLEKAHERLDDVMAAKALAVVTSAVPHIGPALGALVDAAGTDLEGASSLTVKGERGMAVASDLGLLKAEGSLKGAVAVKVDLEAGKPAKGEASVSVELEAKATASLMKKLGDAHNLGGELTAGSTKAALTLKSQFDVDANGSASVTNVDVSATLEVMVGEQLRKIEVTLPPGEDREAVKALLLSGQPQLALERLLTSSGRLKAEGGARMELAFGVSGGGAIQLGLKGHYARQSNTVLDEREGTIGDILGESVSKQVSEAGRGEDLKRQLSAHQQYR